MKEKIKKISQFIIKVVFLALLFVVLGYFVKIITPRYCIVEETRSRLISGSGDYCNWEYALNNSQQLNFTIALFIFIVLIIYFVSKHCKRKN